MKKVLIFIVMLLMPLSVYANDYKVTNHIIDTEVGKTFLYDYGTNGESDIMFSPIGYTTVVGRALQEEIIVRENKIAELENRIVELENKLNQ